MSKQNIIIKYWYFGYSFIWFYYSHSIFNITMMWLQSMAGVGLHDVDGVEQEPRKGSVSEGEYFLALAMVISHIHTLSGPARGHEWVEALVKAVPRCGACRVHGAPLHAFLHDLCLNHLPVLRHQRALEHVHAVDGARKRRGGRVKGATDVYCDAVERNSLMQRERRYGLGQKRLECNFGGQPCLSGV